jgi:hypothetical protein
MAKLPEIRKYQRILPSQDSIKKLESNGFEWVLSSNVSGAKEVDGDLYIRFHNGSIYKYPKRGELFDNLIAASSKGKWVWRFLRRAGVKFQKVGKLPLPEDRQVPDSQIVRPQGEFKVEAKLPTFAELSQGKLPAISISRIKNLTMASSPKNGQSLLSSLVSLDQLSQLGIIA